MQFDVFKNKGRNKDVIPYVLDVQSNLLSENLQTKILVPLYLRKEIPNPVIKLHVPVSIQKKQCIALFDEMSSVRTDHLGKAIDNISEVHSEQCKAALHVLFFNYP